MRSRSLLSAVFLCAVVLLAFAPRARADDQDRVSFGSRIVVGEDETVGDVVCFFCSVEAHGKVNGNIVTFLGNVKTSAPINGDVVAFAGNVLLEDDASIGGDLVVFGGSLRKNGGGRVSQDQVIFPAVIFLIPVLILGGLIWGITALFRRRHPVFYIPPAR